VHFFGSSQIQSGLAAWTLCSTRTRTVHSPSLRRRADHHPWRKDATIRRSCPHVFVYGAARLARASRTRERQGLRTGRRATHDQPSSDDRRRIEAALVDRCRQLDPSSMQVGQDRCRVSAKTHDQLLSYNGDDCGRRAHLGGRRRRAGTHSPRSVARNCPRLRARPNVDNDAGRAQPHRRRGADDTGLRRRRIFDLGG